MSQAASVQVMGFDAFGSSAHSPFNRLNETLEPGEIAINGDVFDVNKILKDFPHPGGDMLLWADGMESTALFFSMHSLSTHRLLQSQSFRSKYLIRSNHIKPSLPILDSFYCTLKDIVEKTAYRKYDSQLIFAWTLSFYVWWLVSYFYMLSTGNFVSSLICATATAFLNFNTMHLSMHGSITTKEPWKTLLDYAYCYAGGGSPVAWRRKHCLGHHVITNDLHDPDKLAQPMIRLHPQQQFRWWYRYQSIYFPFLAMLNILVNQFTHVARLYKGWDMVPTRDRWCLIAAYSFWFGTIYIFPFLMRGWHGVLLGFGTIGIASVISTYTIVVNHMFEEARVTHPNSSLTDSWASRQVEGSSNFNTDSLISLYLSGGLNLQIEHHLFPRLHPIQLYRIRPLVESFCLKHKVSYSKMSYSTLIVSTHKCLHRYGQDR